MKKSPHGIVQFLPSTVEIRSFPEMSPVPQTDPSYKNISQETVQATIFSTNLQPLPFRVRENPSPTSIAWLWAIIKRFCSSYTPSLRVVAAWGCRLQWQGGPLLFINAAPATNQNAPVHERSQKKMYLPTNCAPVRGASGPLLPTGPMFYQLFYPDVIFRVGPRCPENSELTQELNQRLCPLEIDGWKMKLPFEMIPF